MKVYCQDCRYRKVLPFVDLCSVVDECEEHISETHEHPAYVKKVKRNFFTFKKNENNDCKDFKKKYSLIVWEKAKELWLK